MRKILKYLFLLVFSFYSCEKKKTNLSVKSDSTSKHLTEVISSIFTTQKRLVCVMMMAQKFLMKY